MLKQRKEALPRADPNNVKAISNAQSAAWSATMRKAREISDAPSRDWDDIRAALATEFPTETAVVVDRAEGSKSWLSRDVQAGCKPLSDIYSGAWVDVGTDNPLAYCDALRQGVSLLSSGANPTGEYGQFSLRLLHRRTLFVLYTKSRGNTVSIVLGPNAWAARVRKQLANEGPVPVFLFLEDWQGHLRFADAEIGPRTRNGWHLWTRFFPVVEPRWSLAHLLDTSRGFSLVAVVVSVFGSVVSVLLFWPLRRATGKAPFPRDFLAAVSHEFRTPLTSMRHLSEMLESGRIASDEKRQQYYGLLRINSERLLRIVENVLELRRLDDPAQSYRTESLDCAMLIEYITRDFEKSVHEAGVSVNLDIQARPAMISGDTDALRRAIWNVMDNAVKYSPGSTVVRVELARGTDDFLIRVIDRGVGVPKSEMTKVFQPFRRGSAAKATGAPGTGLGLSMTQRILRAHGGRVDLHSEPGAGTTVSLVLPIGG
jgi:signal transduction histidine kinase